MTESANWGPRGWFDVATLTKLSEPFLDVTPSSPNRTLTGNGPRMWLAGGGYMGQNGNSIVSSMIGYVDMWFSTDGLTWHQVRYANTFEAHRRGECFKSAFVQAHAVVVVKRKRTKATGLPFHCS